MSNLMRTWATQLSVAMSITILEPITARKSDTAIPRDIDVSRVRHNYREIAMPLT